MASCNQFDSLESEIEYLQSLNKDEVFYIAKNSTDFKTITIKLRKCIMLEIDMDNEKPISTKIKSFDLSNLKPSRAETMNVFIEESSRELKNQDSNSLVNLLNKAKELLSYSPDKEFLFQTFDILESLPAKHQLFKLDENLSHASRSEKSKKASKLESDNDVKQKFKGSELIFDRIKWVNLNRKSIDLVKSFNFINKQRMKISIKIKL